MAETKAIIYKPPIPDYILFLRDELRNLKTELLFAQYDVIHSRYRSWKWTKLRGHAQPCAFDTYMSENLHIPMMQLWITHDRSVPVYRIDVAKVKNTMDEIVKQLESDHLRVDSWVTSTFAGVILSDKQKEDIVNVLSR